MARLSNATTPFHCERTKRCGRRGRNFAGDGRVAADERFRAALHSLVNALNEVPAPSMIIGGVAVIAAGVPRQTIDIDATVLGREVEVDAVIEALGRYDIVPRISDIREFARDHQVLLLQHAPSGVTIEVSFAWLPFEEEALSHAREIDVEGLSLRVARAEDLIVYKAAAWRDRDRSDIERLLVLHLGEIDIMRVRGLVEEIGSALDDPNRVDAFDRMVTQARKAQ